MATHLFSTLRTFLKYIANTLPEYRVSATFYQNTLSITVCPPIANAKPYTMVLDEETDYDIDADKLIEALAEAARAYYGGADATNF